MNPSLLIERDGALERWVLNDPASRNALSESLVQALFAACTRASLDTDLRFIVLSGAGGSFCAGGSLGGFARSIGQALPPGEADPLIPMNAQFGHLLQALCELPQILVAAVQGAAMGGGFGLVCCADVVLASEEAVFGTPEVTLGIVPAQIAPYVQWRLGDKIARRLLLSGKRHSAGEMLALGLVDAVHPAANLDNAVALQIRALSKAGPHAVASTKHLLYMPFKPVAQAINAQAAIKFVANLRHAEAAEGLQAFAQKRKTSWSL